MKRVCTICARGGSKGVKNKNIRMLLDKPLIVYSILQAKSSGLFDAVAISSDSTEIIDIAVQWGVDYAIKRPDELATDEAPKLPVIQHCVKQVEEMTNTRYDTMVDLDVTSPLRLPEDIRQAVFLLENTGVSNVITGMPARRSPYFNLVELNDSGSVRLSKTPVVPVVRRQDAPKCFDMNASIYVWQRATFFTSKTIFNSDTKLYVMPEERSIDIDSDLDLEFVEFLLRKKANI